VTDENNDKLQEEGVHVPYQQLDQETLRRMIQEFVSRDGADWGDAGCALDDKVEQVFQQLQRQQVKIVFDLRSQTVNIVACR
jgi:uncharacterized protein YheU (UPF0270 family)